MNIHNTIDCQQGLASYVPRGNTFLESWDVLEGHLHVITETLDRHLGYVMNAEEQTYYPIKNIDPHLSHGENGTLCDIFELSAVMYVRSGVGKYTKTG